MDGTIDGLIERKLQRFAPLERVESLEQRIHDLEEENLQLRRKVVEFDRQVYAVKDLASLLHCDVATVRKNYIKTGKIDARKTTAGYEIAKDEYFRVAEIIRTRSKHYL